MTPKVSINPLATGVTPERPARLAEGARHRETAVIAAFDRRPAHSRSPIVAELSR